jgi:threonine aldolase
MKIDLRSDTVTKPSKEMLQAMLEAHVGDDVFSEDPTINLLEDTIAQLFGKEAALFCPSGTMTNQIAIKIHTQPGDELICDEASHIYNFEGGGISFNSLVQAKLVAGNNGRITASQVEDAINPNYDWFAQTKLVSLENTVNRAGGSVYEFAEMQKISDLCKHKNLALHLDGARIFNALEVSKNSPHEIGKLFDTISVCFSKGLGAPVGSALLGTKENIKKARRIRKLFGGGTRQGGFLAAAALFALNNNVARLSQDHQKAKEIEDILKNCSYVSDILPVQTNIIIFTIHQDFSAVDFVEKAKTKNIFCTTFGKNKVRMVTHLDYTSEMHEIVLKILPNIF